LRQVLVFLDAHALNRPGVMIGGAAQKSDAEGNLTDEKTREGIRKLLEGLVRWARQLKSGRAAE
jgi:chromate reductase